MNSFQSIKDLTEKALTVSETNYDTGIKEFSRLNIGFKPGQVIMVGSRPGVGRTMFLLYLFHNFWKTNRIPQAFVSNEEDESQVLKKLISTVTGIKLTEVKENIGDSSNSYPEILKSDDNFIMNYQLSWENLKNELMWLTKEKGVKVFYIDKIQALYSDGEYNNRDQELGHIIRDIKNFAEQNRLIFFISSSLSRSVEYREGKTPNLSDLRESGALEEIADTVMLIHRPEIYGITQDEMGNSLINMAELFIRKNRFGPTGDFRFTFDNRIPRFEDFNASHSHNFEEQFYKTTGIIPEKPF